MLLQVSGEDGRAFSEIAKEWLQYVKEDTGLTIGRLVIIVVAGFFTLKIIRAWRGK